MLKSLYVDNYKCLVNFSLALDPMNLLMGANGVGKSTVLEVLRSLQSFISGQASLTSLFPSTTTTRWMNSVIQKFEFDVSCGVPEEICTYTLEVEHEPPRGKLRVRAEHVKVGNRFLFKFENGKVTLYRDDYSEGPGFDFDWTQTGLNTITERNDNTRLIAFKKAVASWLLVQIRATDIQDESTEERIHPDPHMVQFSSWLRHLSLEQQEVYFELVASLRQILPGFQAFKFETVGEGVKALRLLFGEDKIVFRFAELSDGQRCLIILETLRLSSNGSLLFIDEPGNFVAIREIQPWLTTLHGQCLEGSLQSVLISHHPEFINYLAPDCGIWLDREAAGHTRLQKIGTGDHHLDPAELVARGWFP